MSKITQYTALSAAASNDQLVIVDVDDTTMDASGTTKNITVANLLTGAGSSLTPTAVKTTAYTAAASDLVICDISGGAFTVTLPTAPADKTQVGILIVKISNSNTYALTVGCGGSDVLNIASGATSIGITALDQRLVLQYSSSAAIWYFVSSGSYPERANPDWPPPAGLTYSYEFQGNGTTLPSGWSWTGQGSSTYNEGKGVGAIYNPGATPISGIYRALPTAPFTLTAKLHHSYLANSTNYMKSGLFLTDLTKAMLFSFGGDAGYYGSASGGTAGTAVEYYSTLSTFSSANLSWTAVSDMKYMQIVYTSSSSVAFKFSADGVQFITAISGVNVSTNFTPTQIGIHTQGSFPTQIACQFFRVS